MLSKEKDTLYVPATVRRSVCSSHLTRSLYFFGDAVRTRWLGLHDDSRVLKYIHDYNYHPNNQHRFWKQLKLCSHIPFSSIIIDMLACFARLKSKYPFIGIIVRCHIISLVKTHVYRLSFEHKLLIVLLLTSWHPWLAKSGFNKPYS